MMSKKMLIIELRFVYKIMSTQANVFLPYVFLDQFLEAHQTTYQLEYMCHDKKFK